MTSLNTVELSLDAARVTGKPQSLDGPPMPGQLPYAAVASIPGACAHRNARLRADLPTNATCGFDIVDPGVITSVIPMAVALHQGTGVHETGPAQEVSIDLAAALSDAELDIIQAIESGAMDARGFRQMSMAVAFEGLPAAMKDMVRDLVRTSADLPSACKACRYSILASIFAERRDTAELRDLTRLAFRSGNGTVQLVEDFAAEDMDGGLQLVEVSPLTMAGVLDAPDCALGGRPPCTFQVQDTNELLGVHYITGPVLQTGERVRLGEFFTGLEPGEIQSITDSGRALLQFEGKFMPEIREDMMIAADGGDEEARTMLDTTRGMLEKADFHTACKACRANCEAFQLSQRIADL